MARNIEKFKDNIKSIVSFLNFIIINISAKVFCNINIVKDNNRFLFSIALYYY